MDNNINIIVNNKLQSTKNNLISTCGVVLENVKYTMFDVKDETKNKIIKFFMFCFKECILLLTAPIVLLHSYMSFGDYNLDLTGIFIQKIESIGDKLKNKLNSIFRTKVYLEENKEDIELENILTEMLENENNVDLSSYLDKINNIDNIKDSQNGNITIKKPKKAKSLKKRKIVQIEDVDNIDKIIKKLDKYNTKPNTKEK